MPDALALFDSRRSKWCDPETGELTREAQMFVRALWLRAGGAIGPGTNDLAGAAFEDAGIPEQLGMILLLGDAGRQDPPELPQPGDSEHALQAPPMWVGHRMVEQLESQVAQLTAQVGELARTIHGMQQGSLL